MGTVNLNPYWSPSTLRINCKTRILLWIFGLRSVFILIDVRLGVRFDQLPLTYLTKTYLYLRVGTLTIANRVIYFPDNKFLARSIFK